MKLMIFSEQPTLRIFDYYYFKIISFFLFCRGISALNKTNIFIRKYLYFPIIKANYKKIYIFKNRFIIFKSYVKNS